MQCSSCGQAGSPCVGTLPGHQLNWHGACRLLSGRGKARSSCGREYLLSHAAPRLAERPVAGMPGAAPQPDGAAHVHGPALPKDRKKKFKYSATDFTKAIPSKC